VIYAVFFGHISVQTQCVNYRMLRLLPSDHIVVVRNEPTFETACRLAELCKECHVEKMRGRVCAAELSNCTYSFVSVFNGVPFGFGRKGGIECMQGNCC
jgi:hypothetical protein